MQSERNTRLRHLDFLRGIAILLVLLTHSYLFDFTSNLGPIGVDLFFVLSGFLVSGLLFKEYIKYGDVKPVLFLIRRGFKIYPLFWMMLILFWILNLYKGLPILYPRLIAEFFFLQNYVSGWGYAIHGVSWSVAVEEHFYIGLAVILPLLIRKKWINVEAGKTDTRVERTIVFIMITCLCLRIISNYLFPESRGRNYTMTHLRIDSILAGVLISYWYYFKQTMLTGFYEKYKKYLMPVAFLLLSFSPFVDPPDSFFAKTIGFTLLFIGFSSMLIYFILNRNINETLDKIFTRNVVFIISRIGYYSYSIYLIHIFVNDFFSQHLAVSKFVYFIVSNSVSLLIGMLLSKYVEYYFLSLRDKWWPARK